MPSRYISSILPSIYIFDCRARKNLISCFPNANIIIVCTLNYLKFIIAVVAIAFVELVRSARWIGGAGRWPAGHGYFQRPHEIKHYRPGLPGFIFKERKENKIK